MTPARATLLALLVSASLDLTAAPLFRRPLPIDIGAVNPGDAGPLVSADFNHDGFPDVAMTHTDGRLAIALNNGSGPFAATTIFPVPAGIIAMVAADLDADGDVDLVYTRERILGRLIGNGDGTFAGPTELSSAGGLLAVGDFNGDGKLDAAAVNDDARVASTVSLHLGDGSGTLASAVTTSIPEAAVATIGAQLNGTAGDELIVASDGNTRIWSVAANGSLQLLETAPGGVALAAGRFDADASVDLAIVHVVNRDASLLSYGGDGDGTLTLRATYPLPEDGPIVAVDIDRDGALDLLTTSAVLTYFKGLGTGTFAAPQFSPVSPDSQLAVDDFDRDGQLDLVTLQADPALLEFVNGDGDGTFGPDRTFVAHAPPVLDDETFGAARDMNGDGRPDVVVVVTQADLTYGLAVLRNDGSGGLLAPVIVPTGLTTAEPAALVAGLINGDNRVDVVVIGTEAGVEKAITYLGNADGTLSRGTAVAAVFPDEAPTPRLADMNGDGHVDLLIDWSWHAGDGNGTFAAGIERTLSFHVVADFDEDGDLDVVGLRDLKGARMELARNNGSGTFGAPVALTTGSDLPYAAGDFNGDGHLDLFAMNPTVLATKVYLGHGDATFDAPISVSVPLFADSHEVSTADFDGDGNLDVSFSTVVLLGDGHGRFRDFEIGSLNFDSSGVADFDGNGTLDVCSFGDLVTIWLTGLAPVPPQWSLTFLLSQATITYPSALIATVQTAGNLVPVTGTIVFSIDDMPVAIVNATPVAASRPQTNSQSTINRTLPPGTYALAAQYNGDRTYKRSSIHVTQTVERGMAGMNVTASGTYGTDATVTINFTVVNGQAVPDATKLSLLKDGAPLAGVVWTGSVAKIRGLAAGEHSLMIEFAGDTYYRPSTRSLTLVVAKRPVAMTVVFTPTGTNRIEGPVTAGVSFTTGVYGSITGTVSATYNNASTATAPLANDRADVTATLPAGSYDITVSYPGDANNLPISNQSFILVYNPPGRAITASATADGSGGVEIRWTPIINATSYVVYRRITPTGAWQTVGTISAQSTVAIDNQPSNTTRMYAVAPVISGNIGDRSAPDLATSVTFTDTTLPGALVRTAHAAQLRSAVNAVRLFAGLQPFSFTTPVTVGTTVRASQVTDLRTALTQARNALAMPISFTDPNLAAGQTIRAVHFEELRSGVR